MITDFAIDAGMRVAVETIGPDEARAMLERSGTNFRSLNKRRVSAYSADVRDDRWHLNGETIKLDKYGNVIDGQHRLAAVIAAGGPATFLVVRGIEPHANATIDIGQNRTLAQYCKWRGYKHTSHVSSIARAALAYRKQGGIPVEGLRYDIYTQIEAQQFVDANIELIESATRTADRAQAVCPVSALGTVLFLGCCGEPAERVDVATWFVEQLRTGSDVGEMDAVHHLRNRFLVRHNAKQKMTRSYQLILCAMAWNKTVLGEPCTARGLCVAMTGPNAKRAPERIITIQEADGGV